MNTSLALLRVCLLSAAVSLAVLPVQASAQEVDHSKMNMPAVKPAPAKKVPVAKKAAPRPVAKPVRAAEPAPAMDHSGMGHSTMQMPMPAAKPTSAPNKPASGNPRRSPSPNPPPRPMWG